MKRQSTTFKPPPILTWSAIIHQAANLQQPVRAHAPFESHGEGPSRHLGDEIRHAWMVSLGAEEPAKLQKRLSWSGIEESQIAPLLCRPCAEVPYHRDSDSLFAKLSDAIRAEAGRTLSSKGPACTSVIDTEQLAFVDLWAPVAEWAQRELCTSLTDQLYFQIGASIWEELSTGLLSRLCRISEMTLWQKFNEERDPDMILRAHLGEDGDGEGPPTREFYTRFIQRHRSEGVERLMAEFPVLGRLISTVTALWLKSSAEMLLRIDADRDVLSQTFDIPLDASLEHVQPGLSDPHCGGRSVARLTFGGTSASYDVIYKPKDIRLDAAYHKFISYLNSISDLPALKTLRMLQGNGYGYVEFVPHCLCSNTNELARFYHNAGRLTAILYLLGCTDCHYENLIANGDHLVLIDGETLFQADFEKSDDRLTCSASEASVKVLQRQIDDSVLRSGLLPMWQYYGQHKFAMDLSALGIAPPTEPVEETSGWLGLNSDGMLAGIIETPCRIPTSLPVGVGASNPLHVYVDRFCDGFKVQCDVLMQHRSELLREEGPLNAFQGLQRRILKRGTWIYYAIQDQMMAPDALRSELAQGMCLEQLGRAFLLTDQRPKDWPVFEDEMRQMEVLDIPFFTHAIDRVDMEAIGAILGFVKANGLEACRKRLACLNTDSVAFQLRLIRGAIQARVMRADQRHDTPSSSRSTVHALTSVSTEAGLLPAQVGLSKEARLGLSQNVFHQLIDLAFHDSTGRYEWLGMNMGWDVTKYYFGPVGQSLYSGSTGIALFLTCLQYALKPSEGSDGFRPSDTILGQITQPLIRLTEMGDETISRWWRDQPLGLAGCGGTLLTLITLDRLAIKVPDGFESYIALAHSLLRGLSHSRLETDRELDLLQGVTGLIGPLLMLGDTTALKWARMAGHRLVEQQHESGGWIVPSAQARRPLTGWAHGAAGMLASLAQLYHHTGDRCYLRAAEQGLDYERQVFVPEVGNWSDFRCAQESAYFHLGWCNGAPGIALSRLCLMGTELWNQQIEEELFTAIATTANASLSRDYLCCGRFGLVAILRMAAQHLDSLCPQIEEAANQIEWQALSEAQQSGGNYQLLGDGEGSIIEPGLMTGVSGIGMVLLNDWHSLATLQMILSGGLLPVSRR